MVEIDQKSQNLLTLQFILTKFRLILSRRLNSNMFQSITLQQYTFQHRILIEKVNLKTI